MLNPGEIVWVWKLEAHEPFCEERHDVGKVPSRLNMQVITFFFFEEKISRLFCLLALLYLPNRLLSVLCSQGARGVQRLVWWPQGFRKASHYDFCFGKAAKESSGNFRGHKMHPAAFIRREMKKLAGFQLPPSARFQEDTSGYVWSALELLELLAHC